MIASVSSRLAILLAALSLSAAVLPAAAETLVVYSARNEQLIKPVFDQFQQELPLNHRDMPPEELPQTRQDMKALLDSVSRWLN